MTIEPHETEIVGEWILQNGKVHSNAACQRIYALIQTELVYMGKDESGWEALYVDKNDGRYWERTFPHGELQAGGPPTLRVISYKDAVRKYGLAK